MKPLVSIITPTGNRCEFLALLQQCVVSQTYRPLEWLIYDGGSQPFTPASRDDGVSVQYCRHAEHLSIGAKRDWLVGRASGAVIVHFDDDDYYHNTYIDTMVTMLGENDVAKLSAWVLSDCINGDLYYWDCEEVASFHYVVGDGRPARMIDARLLSDAPQAWARHQVLGYGFSYVYRQILCQSVRFDPADNKGEDYNFITKCLDVGANIQFVKDCAGIAVHCLHSANTSRAFPNYKLPMSCVGKEQATAIHAYWAVANGLRTKSALQNYITGLR